MCTISVCRILFSQHYRYVFCAKQCCCPCHCTSAPDQSVWFHGSRGENITSLLGVWDRGKRSAQDIADQIQIKISSPGGIADGVQVPTLRTSPALTPSTEQRPQKQARPKWLQILSFRNPRMFPSGLPILEIQLVYLGWLGGK